MIRLGRWWITDQDIVVISNASVGEDTLQLGIDIVRVSEVLGFLLFARG